jgi:hypothetical protein
MEFVDMKLEEPVNSTAAEPIKEPSGPKFPYGLKLRFEKEQIEQYPALKLLDVGDKVLIDADATVVSKSMSEEVDGNGYCSIEIQIEKISVEKENPKPVEQMTQAEYRILRNENKI